MNIPQYDLEFEDRGDYLYAYLSGFDSFAASLDYWNKIADKVEELGHKKLLVHENLQGNISFNELYELLKDLRQSILMKTKVAFHDEQADDSIVNKFGRLIANHWGANIRIFESLGAAQSWIEQAS